MAGRRVAVLFGGPSAEHSISIRSADGLTGWLLAAGFTVLLVHLRRDGTWAFGDAAADARTDGAASRLARQAERGLPIGDAVARLVRDADVVFPIVHGTLGEDGALQGFVRVVGLPCVGSSWAASAFAMDKARAKALLAATTTIRMARSVTVSREEFARERDAALARCRRLTLPCIVKPVDAGSSVGLSQVDAPDGWGALADAVAQALAVEGVTGAMVEEKVVGEEVTCAVYGDPETEVLALPPILIRPRASALFDWKAKYEPGGSDEICPAPLPRSALARIEQQSIAAYRALGCRGFARVDFVLTDGVPWFLELNTLPGLTTASLLPKALVAAEIEPSDFFRRVVERAFATRVGLAESARERAAS
jgi:D-alanine-D-alanine ligase